MTDLTDKQQAFVAAYLADPERNASAAARKAGFNARQAPNLMSNPAILAAIDDQAMADLAQLGATGTRAEQVARCDAIYAAAVAANNFTAAIASTKLKSELL